MNALETIAAVEQLREELEGVELRLEVPGADDARANLSELLGQIDDYLLPRLRAVDAPLLAVVGGSTGAGKSTLVNSLLGREVSAAGVLRPTTTTPVLACNPGDVGWFEDDRILPGLARTTGAAPGGAGLHLVVDEDVPPGLALLDAPDIDSVVETNRELAAQLLAAADLWLFVTSAARYADAVPWGYLRRARDRSTALAVVLDRIPPEAAEEVPRHLAQMLQEQGLGDTPLLTIPECSLEHGLIPAPALEPVRTWLLGLAADAAERARVVRQTLQGALASAAQRAASIAAHLEEARAAGDRLVEEVHAAYGVALREIEDGLSGGPLLRGEVLARWHEFIGTGDFMRSLQGAIGRFRDRVSDALMGRPPVEAEVRSEVERGIGAVMVAACDKAAERTIQSWRATPWGAGLVRAAEVPPGSSPGLAERVDAEVRAWQGHVLEMVSAEGADKRKVGRALAFGVNAIGAALMVAVFASTGGLTGGEVVVAGGTATLSQRLLEAVFGDQAVRTLTARARADLLARLQRLLQEEGVRYEAAVAGAVTAPERVDRLRRAAEALGTAS